jgi:adenylate kinase
MRGFIGICGTPGTGKKTVAPLVASLLGLSEPVFINSLAREGEVDPRIVRRKLLRLDLGRAVVVGHLLPHVLIKSEVDMVAVLRCEPSLLRKRLSERKYPSIQVMENIEAELIGVVLDECIRRFGSDLIREYDTSSASPEMVAASISRDVKDEAVGKRLKPGTGVTPRWIDWTLDYGSSNKLRSLLGGGSEGQGST